MLPAPLAAAANRQPHRAGRDAAPHDATSPRGPFPAGRLLVRPVNGGGNRPL